MTAMGSTQEVDKAGAGVPDATAAAAAAAKDGAAAAEADGKEAAAAAPPGAAEAGAEAASSSSDDGSGSGMSAWLNGDSQRNEAARGRATVSTAAALYRNKVLPIEKDHQFHQLHSPEMADADFLAKPMVLLIGQYSTGKSTFIQHLLGRSYPGLRIGPEPTTDKFVAVMHGTADQTLLGNACVVDRSMPFTQLNHFGNAFLSRFEVSCLNSPVLEGISLIDSPGVLSGEKQRLNRGYDMEAVVKWFADRVDMILLLFDVSKLDISDEFRRVIMAVKGNDVKIHIILNKADKVTTPQLMRVYGALMWVLGKVIDTPEVKRVYIGSFWDKPLTHDEQRKLFESEAVDLYTQLAQLPQDAAHRKLNGLIKRVRLAKVHAHLIDYLKRKMDEIWQIWTSKEAEQKKMIANLPAIYNEIAKDKNLSIGDFPDAEIMAQKLAECDFTRFNKINAKKMEALENMLNVEIPKLLAIQRSETAAQERNQAKCQWMFQDAGTGLVGFSEMAYFKTGLLGAYWSRELGIEDTISELQEQLEKNRGIILSFDQTGTSPDKQFATTGEAIAYLTSIL